MRVGTARSTFRSMALSGGNLVTGSPGSEEALARRRRARLRERDLFATLSKGVGGPRGTPTVRRRNALDQGPTREPLRFSIPVGKARRRIARSWPARRRAGGGHRPRGDRGHEPGRRGRGLADAQPGRVTLRLYRDEETAAPTGSTTCSPRRPGACPTAATRSARSAPRATGSRSTRRRLRRPRSILSRRKGTCGRSRPTARPARCAPTGREARSSTRPRGAATAGAAGARRTMPRRSRPPSTSRTWSIRSPTRRAWISRSRSAR